MAKQGTRFKIRYLSIFLVLLFVVPVSYSHQSPPVTESTNITDLTKENRLNRYYVKYQKGGEGVATALVKEHEIAIVDVIPTRNILIVFASKQSIQELVQNAVIEYVELEPVRSFYSQ
ncbi:MAG: RAB protein geranylgeranyltransferase component A [Moritella dasanensis]|jgi:RAB protein geranylgeranyltransferase component A